MGTTAVATFNGSSQYASDLQQAINRAVAIASLPVQQLSDSVATWQSQSSELSTLESKFGAIQTAIQSLSSASSGGGLEASSSDNTVATATLNPATAVTAGTYSLNVISAGAPTTTLSTTGTGILTVTDPSASSISSSGTFTLTVNGVAQPTITPSSNTLNALAQAINAAGDGVSATIVNLGSPSSPDYRLSLQSNALGNVPIQLNDGTTNLLTTLTTGSEAEYQVDGQPPTPTGISSNSSTVTIAPGLTVDLLKAGQTTVTVTPGASAASDALSSFVAAYNAAVTELRLNHGSSGGALTGQPIVFQLEQSLRSLTGYSGGSGAVKNLAALGVTFNDTSGQLSFDPAQFENLASSDPADVASFLGSATGGGFLTVATNTLTNLEDPANGTIPADINGIQKQITSANQSINDQQARITTMYNSLVAQMSAADAAIASLESQVSFFTSLFTTENALRNGG